ncbi:DMT family transporter [Pinisolibacter sp.]|uniref:DMT family transporter n=1 Tax=Pinisolibacter sp. TaxID=2172024 RepID=UPI002FDD14C7
MAGTTARPNEDRPMLAIALMLLTYLGFSCVDAAGKSLVLAGIPAFQAAFFRYFGHSVIALALIARQGGSVARFGTTHKRLVLTRGFILMFSTVINFFALRYLPLTLTATILFSAPIIIAALSGPVLGERVGIWRWSAIVAGFVGIVVALRPFDASFHWAMLLSFTNAVIFAVYSLMTRKLAGSVSTDTMQLYAGLIGTVVLAPVAAWVWVTPGSLVEWVLLLGMGVFGWASHETLTRAYGYAEAGALTPYTYIYLLYMGFWGWFLFDTVPDRWTMAGAAIIIASGLVIWMRERRLNRSTRP